MTTMTLPISDPPRSGAAPTSVSSSIAGSVSSAISREGRGILAANTGFPAAIQAPPRCCDARAGGTLPIGGRRRQGRGRDIDKVISWVVITVAGMLAVMAIIRNVMPPLADATNSLQSSGATIDADVEQVITIGAVS